MPPVLRSFFTLERFRRQLANVDALPQLCILGLVAGMITGSLMVGFRFMLSLGALVYMPDGNPEAFEQLAPLWRALLPLVAVLLIGAWLIRQTPAARKIGVAHVIDRLTYHQGRFPRRNWLTQWWVGLISVLGGLSAGREGPAIHLGAAAASGLGQKLRLPHNSLRVLVACGTAAGISASFNTPIAGVIFAMEVVMMEYTIVGFMPVIMAATVSGLMAQLAFGFERPFQASDVMLGSLINLPWIVVSGFGIGLLASGFVRLARAAERFSRLSLPARFALVGVLVGLVAWFYPQVQGMGYDTLGLTFSGELAVDVLIAVAVGKLLLTAFTVACGIPVSIIGPILVAGGAAGALFGLAGTQLMPELSASPTVYAMLGMAAMMGAILQAPLAALMALLELTHTPNMMLPGMLAVVIACLTTRQLTGCKGFFISAVHGSRHPLQHPLMQALSRISVPAVMERNLVRTPRVIAPETARKLLDNNPVWLVIERKGEGKPLLALKGAILARWLLEHEAAIEQRRPGFRQIDLLEIPGRRLELAPIGLQATLSEAFLALQNDDLGALYVTHGQRLNKARISGIITRGAIERYYHFTDRLPESRSPEGRSP
ncbi:chloride channel protein [Vreelandella jeotgali]|uniref:chloride channel protein n=1 Tax=Vreelandella jeotgali TaxID=553386 RepID=UPI000347B2AF|nr:chloride channel protein [Halomonas jeotgali]